MNNERTASVNIRVKMEMSDNRCETEINNNENSSTSSLHNNSEEVTPSAEFDPVENLWIKEKCIFCENLLINLDGVKMLQCLHSSCSPCITSRASADGTVTCQSCKVESNSYIDNYFVLEQANASDDGNCGNESSRLSEVKCTSCSESPTATSWCVECCEFICDACVQAHQRLKITKEHTIKSKEEAMTDKAINDLVDDVMAKSMCNVHCQEKLTLYCETCNTLTCRDCQLTEHREHKYKFIDEMATTTKKDINTLLSEVNYKRVLLKSAMSVIDDRQHMISNKRKVLCNEITQAVYKLTSSVASRGKQLVAKLNEVCEAKQKTLNDKKKALEHLAFLTDHCIQSINSAITHGSDMSILRSKGFIMNYLRDVKSKRADIPNPDIPVRIQVNLDRVAEIANVVSTLGSVMVDGRVYPSPSSSPAPSPSSSLMLPHGQQLQQNIQPVQQQQLQPQQISQNATQDVQHASAHQQQLRGGPVTLQHQPAQNHPQRSYSTSPQAIVNTNNVFQPPPPYTVNSKFPVVYQSPAPKNIQNLQQIPTNGPQIGKNILTYQQQVTSSTHPQNLLPQYAQDQNLRSLLMNSEKQQTFQINSANPIMRTNTSSAVNPSTNTIVRHSTSVAVQGLHVRAPLYTQVRYCPQSQSPTTMPKHNVNAILKVECKPPSSLTPVMSIPQNRSNLYVSASRSSVSPQPTQVQWHTPQISTSSNIVNKQVPSLLTASATTNDESYKIMLRPPRSHSSTTPPGVSVSSSVSKTPSPQNQVKTPEETEKNIDKLGQDSVKDLMATIAKLDSNGIVVIPGGSIGSRNDHKRKPNGSPLVDSSTGPQMDQLLNNGTTDEINTNHNIVGSENQRNSDDPNEDWCAVCMDGGELVCCDNCPKVFHASCHIPTLSSLASEMDSWQCMLCTNISECVSAISAGTDEKQPGEGLTMREQKVMERILLELYCQYEPSLPFRELIGAEATEYYEKIKTPMCFDIIRKRLTKKLPTRYENLCEVIKDIRLIFKNAYIFNEKGSQIYNDAKTLEEFFDQMLEKWLPVYSFDDSLRITSLDDDEDDEFSSGPPSKRCKRLNNQ